MLKLLCNKDDSFLFKKKLALCRGAPQENDAKFRFAIHPQGIQQFYDNCKIAKCQTVVYCIIMIVTCFMYSETNSLSRFPCVKPWSCNLMLENKTNY